MNVDLEKLPAYLQSRRWFGGKAWPIKAVSVLEHAVLPQGDAVLAIVEVTYSLGAPERYVLPVSADPAGGLRESLNDDENARALLTLIRGEQALPMGAGTLTGLRLAPTTVFEGLRAEPDVRRILVEQTNTSLVFDEKLILKLIRRLEQGVHPEQEVGAFLAERTSFRDTPPLVGALELRGSLSGTIAVLHRFVPNSGDGWAYTTAAFGKDSLAPALLAEAKALGKLVGELHVALGSDRETPAFAPEPLQKEDLHRWSSSITGELGVTLAAATALPDLAARREALVARAHRLADAEPSGEKLRIHGDLHLGQALHTPKGWLLFDFEGEPGRSYAQRREKHSPLKDVAAMLRSFSYAAAASARETGRPASAGPAREAFLEGYLGVARGASFLPKGELFRTLLEALEFEKLLYELRYELNNRPDWVQIPADALLAL